MNVKQDTCDDLPQADVKRDRITRIKTKNPRRAANASLVGTVVSTPQHQAEKETKEPDPRKVRDLNADDFFELGKCRI